MGPDKTTTAVQPEKIALSRSTKALRKELPVEEVPGDLFDAPHGSALIHSCNALGHWGKGIAWTFRKRYPAAYRLHVKHCKKHFIGKSAVHDIPDLQVGGESTVSTRLPLGTAQIIPPQPSDRRSGEKGHWVICLFTSNEYGRRADPVDQIINNTHAALLDLKRQLGELEQEYRESGAAVPGELYACRFNAGLFAIPWARTRRLVEEVGLKMTVVYPVEDIEG